MKTKKSFNGRGKSSVHNRNRGESTSHHGHKSPPQNQKQRAERSGPRLRISLYGSHAVAEALKNPERTIHHIYATEQTEDEVVNMVEEAMALGRDLPHIELLEKETIDRVLPKGTVHQGIALDCDPLQDAFMPDLINRAATKEKSVVVLLDQVTDPHNLGAIIRSACAFGADGIIVQSRHAPELSGLVAKIASGAMEHIPVIYETNLARAIENLQEHGFFAVAMDERGEKTIGEAPKYRKTLLVMGAEGPGLRPLVRDKCDILVKLPTSGALSSLNVSNAAAVALYAVSRD